jgi:hypothetical protein
LREFLLIFEGPRQHFVQQFFCLRCHKAILAH